MITPAFFHGALKSAFSSDLLDKILPQAEQSEVLGKSGSLEVRLARSVKDIKRAQKLRYRVFFEEMSAIPDFSSRLKRRDIDPFDEICDHLLVVDTAPPAKSSKTFATLSFKPRVVGTYRLLRQDVALRHGGFYSANEFDLAPILNRHKNLRFLELGRSCVEAAYRDKRTIELLWHGIWAYVRHHKMDVLFGCASFAGTDLEYLTLPLNFLHHHAQAKSEWMVSAQKSRAIPLDRLRLTEIDSKTALHAMPPLIKAYLRIGARFGPDAVIDHQFGTTDVLVILPVSDIHPKYVSYFGMDGNRYAT